MQVTSMIERIINHEIELDIMLNSIPWIEESPLPRSPSQENESGAPELARVMPL